MASLRSTTYAVLLRLVQQSPAMRHALPISALNPRGAADEKVGELAIHSAGLRFSPGIVTLASRSALCVN